MEIGTCDICGYEGELEMIVLCEECDQSSQICCSCVDEAEETDLYCHNCGSVLDLS